MFLITTQSQNELIYRFMNNYYIKQALYIVQITQIRIINMHFSRSNKIIVDEYDQLHNSRKHYKDIGFYRQNNLICQFCEEKVSPQFMKSHRNLCYISEKKQEYFIGKNKNNIHPSETLRLSHTQKANSNLKFINNNKAQPTSAKFRQENQTTIKTKDHSHSIKRPLSSTGNRSSSKSKQKKQVITNQNKTRTFDMKKFINRKDEVTKNIRNKNGSNNKKMNTNIFLDSKILKQSIDRKLISKKDDPIRNSMINRQNKSKLKKRKVNRSMIHESGQEYYVRKNLNSNQKNEKKQPMKKPNEKQENRAIDEYSLANSISERDAQENNIIHKCNSKNRHLRKQQQEKIKQIEVQRERLQKEKNKLIKEMESQKKQNQEKIKKEQKEQKEREHQRKRKIAQQRQRQQREQRETRQRERLRQRQRQRQRQQQRNRERQRQQQRQRRRYGRRNGNERRRRNQQRRRNRMSSQNESEFGESNGQGFNFIQHTINEQFSLMKEQFNQMNQIFSNFVPFNNNGFVYFQRGHDFSEEYFDSDDEDSSDQQFEEEVHEDQGLNPSQISMLNHYSYQKKLGTDDQCTVCLNSIKHNEQIRQLPCAHLFHINCIDEWLLKKTSCPVCREDILNSLA